MKYIIVKLKNFPLYLLLACRSRKGLRPPNEISYNSDRNICLVAGLTILIYVNVLPGDIVS